MWSHGLHSRAAFLALAVALSFLLSAAQPALAQVDIRTVKLSGTIDDFRNLQILANGNGAFSATWVGSPSDSDNAWWIESQEVLREGAPAQGIPGAVYSYLALHSALDHAGFGPFYAQVTGGSVTSDDDSGTWVTGSPGFQLVLRENTTHAPGTDPGVFFVGSGSERTGSGSTIGFTAGLSGPGVVCTIGDPDYNCTGIWTGSPTSPTLAVRAGEPAPGAAPAVLAQFSGSNYHFFMNPSGVIAFSAQIRGPGVIAGVNDAGIWAGPPGGLWLVARRGDTPPGKPGGAYSVPTVPSLNALGRVAFSDGYGIWAGFPQQPELIVELSQSVPNGGSLYWLGHPAISNRDHVAFKAGVSNAPGNGSAYFIAFGGQLTEVVRQGDTAPGIGHEFKLLRTNAVVNSSGQIAFYAALDDGVNPTYGSIWITDCDGDLTMIVREGDVLEVTSGVFRTVDELLFMDNGDFNLRAGLYDGVPRHFNENGEVIFRADFTDGTSGVFTASLSAGTCALLFDDGFESGDTDAWDSSTP